MAKIRLAMNSERCWFDFRGAVDVFVGNGSYVQVSNSCLKCMVWGAPRTKNTHQFRIHIKSIIGCTAILRFIVTIYINIIYKCFAMHYAVPAAWPRAAR